MAKKKAVKARKRKRAKHPKTIKGDVICDNDRMAPLKFDVFDLFVEWFATPQPLRALKNQGQFAIEHKVNPATLSDWKLRKDFWELVKAKTDDWCKERTPQVIAKLYDQIMDSDTINVEAFKLWLEMYHGYQSSARLRIEGNVDITPRLPLEAIPDDQLDAFIAKRDKVRLACLPAPIVPPDPTE